MEPACSKDEQRIQLLSAEDSESNSPEIQLQRPESCLNRYWKILIITPLLVLLLLLTYWITNHEGARSPTNTPGNESLHILVNHTSGPVTEEPQIDVQNNPDGCQVGLYTLAKIQMNDFDQYGTSETIPASEIRHNGQLIALHEEPGKSIRAEILVEETPIHARGGSSLVAFIGGAHSTGIGLFTDNKNGTYTICCSIPPECVNITVRLYSYDYSAYKAVEEGWGTHDSDGIGIRTVYKRRLCPSQASVDAGMSHIPPTCTQNAVSMKPGSWTQINTQWFWKSHQENCLVPDMSVDWIPCVTKTFQMRFFGDITSHWYSFYMTEFLKSLPQNSIHNIPEHKYTYASKCEDIHTHLFGVQTLRNKLTYVVIHCGSSTFFENGYEALQNEIIALFAKIREIKTISPNLRFVFILSTLKQQVSMSRPSQYTELNLFSSAAINSWIADRAGIEGITVFDDMYPKTMGLAHIGIIDKPLANLLMYHMCNIN